MSVSGLMRVALGLGAPGRSGGAKMATLAQNLMPQGSVVYSDFEGTPTWTVTDGSIAYDTDRVWSGTKSLKVTPDAGMEAKIVTPNGSWDFSNAAYVRMRYYVHAGNPPAQLRFMLWSSGGHADRYALPPGDPFLQDWNTLQAHQNGFILSVFDWANPVTKVEIRTKAAAGQQPSVSYDALELIPETTKACLVTFDDGRDSAWDAFEYCKSKGVRGTMYIITERPGGVGYLTVEQLQEADAAGWDIGNHTHSHTDLSAATEEQTITALTTAKNTLDGWGLSRASAHVAYPYGAYNATTLTAMSAAQMVTGRTVATGWYASLPPANNLTLPCYAPGPLVTLEQAKGVINSAVARGLIPIVLFHRFTAGTPGASEWNLNDFKSLVDWLIAQQIYPLTITDFYALQSGPVTVPQPW